MVKELEILDKLKRKLPLTECEMSRIYLGEKFVIPGTHHTTTLVHQIVLLDNSLEILSRLDLQQLPKILSFREGPPTANTPLELLIEDIICCRYSNYLPYINIINFLVKHDSPLQFIKYSLKEDYHKPEILKVIEAAEKQILSSKTDSAAETGDTSLSVLSSSGFSKRFSKNADKQHSVHAEQLTKRQRPEEFCRETPTSKKHGFKDATQRSPFTIGSIDKQSPFSEENTSIRHKGFLPAVNVKKHIFAGATKQLPKGSQSSEPLPTLGVRYDDQFTFVTLKAMLQAYNLKGIEVIHPSTLIVTKNSHLFVEEGSHCTNIIRLPVSFNAHTFIVPIILSKSPNQSHWIFLVAKDLEVTLIDTEVDDATFNLIKEMLPSNMELKRSSHKQCFSDSCGVEGIDGVISKIFPTEADIHKDPASAALVQNMITLHNLLGYLDSFHSNNEVGMFESVKTFAFNLIKKAYFELILPYAEFAKGLVPSIVYKIINGDASINDLMEGLEAIKAQVPTAGLYTELAGSINDAMFIPMKGGHKPRPDDSGDSADSGESYNEHAGKGADGDLFTFLTAVGAEKEDRFELTGEVKHKETELV